MITLSGVEKSHGGRTLFGDVSLQFMFNSWNSRERDRYCALVMDFSSVFQNIIPLDCGDGEDKRRPFARFRGVLRALPRRNAREENVRVLRLSLRKNRQNQSARQK